jgi:hypothetical protein
MSKREKEKRFVKKDEIRGNPGLSLDMGYILKCTDYIQPKHLVIPVWLVAAGPMGCNLAEMKTLTGLGFACCETTLDILVRRELAIEEPPTLPGEYSRWFANGQGIDYTIGRGDSDAQNDSQGQDVRVRREGRVLSKEESVLIIDPERIYKTSTLDVFIGSKADIKTTSIFSSKTDCNEKNNDSPGIQEKCGSPENDNLPINATENGLPAAPEKPKIRRKKRLKLKKKSPRAALAQDIATENQRRYGKPKTYQTYKKNPSKNPGVLDWQHKSNPNRWNPLDWVGYWLYRWNEYYGTEDPDFVDQTLYRTIGKSREQSNGNLDIYWATGLKIQKFRDSTRTFKGDGQAVKDFVDWLFSSYLPDNAHWLDTPVASYQIFKIVNNHFLGKYRVRDIKPRNGKKKKRSKKWHHWGYSGE